MRTESSQIQRARQLLCILLLSGAAACEPTSAPTPRAALDTQAALQDYQTLQSIFASEGWAGFSALSGRSPLSSDAGMSAMQALPQLRDAASSRTFALQLVEALGRDRDGSSLGSLKILSDTILGRTFVYDPVSDQYVIDPNRTGAPSNGVRFILYGVNSSDRPVLSNEIGYVNLLDEGPLVGDEVVLRLVAVERGTTIIDYRTRAEWREGFARIDVEGFVVDGANQLDFDIGVIGEDVGGQTQLDIDFTLAIDSRGFEIVGSVDGIEDAADGAGRIVVSVRHREQMLRVDMENDGASLVGEIALNGQAFVTVSGDAQNPTLLGASGDPITGQELLVVLKVIDIVDDVFDLVEDLVQPVDNLLLLGWLL